jgi:peptidoglycan hydrolase-like protein with peptidoglycan-binding domain
MRRFQLAQERALFGIRYPNVTTRFVILCIVVGLAVVAAVSIYRSYGTTHSSGDVPRAAASSDGWADDNIRQVQEKLREGGFFSGEIDGAYSTELAAALVRYQIRNGLPITGQLDLETSNALSAKPAVAANAATRERSSETWRQLRRGEQRTRNDTRVARSADANETMASQTGMPPKESPSLAASNPDAKPASAPLTTAADSSDDNISTERVRDYVGAFVLAGLDPQVGAETEFFADRVQYYDEGTIGRENIRRDLHRYAARWPERRFWLAGDIRVEPQNGNRVRVTFPLRYELRNGRKHSSGKIAKTIVLEPTGNDLQIVAVNERKAK